MTSSTDIVNEAIELIGNNTPGVTGVAPDFDSSPAGVAASYLYTPTVQAVGRQFGWDFARNIAALASTGNPPPVGWSEEYLYPASGIEIRQLTPAVLADPNNPLPLNWVVGNAVVAGVPAKVIWCNEAGALALISNQPPEDLWDALYHQAVVRLLAGALAMALEGRPETARDMLESGMQFEALGEQRRD